MHNSGVLRAYFSKKSLLRYRSVPFTAVLRNGKARISYRFRPKATVHETIEQLPEGDPVPRLGMDDYVWEIAAGGDDIDLNIVMWKNSFGTRFSTDGLHQGYLVVLMEALRDVESRLAAPTLHLFSKSWSRERYRKQSKLRLSVSFKRRTATSTRVRLSATLALNSATHSRRQQESPLRWAYLWDSESRRLLIFRAD